MTNSTNTRQPTSHIAPFGVRMQPELKAQLEAAAKESGRSMNAEIVARLEQTFSSSMEEGASTLERWKNELLATLADDITKKIAEKAAKNDIAFKNADGSVTLIQTKHISKKT